MVQQDMRSPDRRSPDANDQIYERPYIRTPNSTNDGEDQMSAALQLEPNMSDAEWHARCELAALYHVINDLGWTDLINTHMSARVPGEANHFLINNYGEMFDEITASSLVKMDMEGNA